MRHKNLRRNYMRKTFLTFAFLVLTLNFSDGRPRFGGNYQG